MPVEGLVIVGYVVCGISYAGFCHGRWGQTHPEIELLVIGVLWPLHLIYSVGWSLGLATGKNENKKG